MRTALWDPSRATHEAGWGVWVPTARRSPEVWRLEALSVASTPAPIDRVFGGRVRIEKGERGWMGGGGQQLPCHGAIATDTQRAMDYKRTKGEKGGLGCACVNEHRLWCRLGENGTGRVGAAERLLAAGFADNGMVVSVWSGTASSNCRRRSGKQGRSEA